MRIFFLFFFFILVYAQETQVIKKTEIYSSPSAAGNSSVGELLPGTKITKLQKDQSGKFVKATMDFYIPIDAIKESRVSFPAGADQTADQAKYRLLSAKLEGKRVRISIMVTNIHATKDLDFSAMALLKMLGKEDNKGELNPFEGKHQDLAIIKPNQTITAELIYDFKTLPQNVELICSGKMQGDNVNYNLGF